MRQCHHRYEQPAPVARPAPDGHNATAMQAEVAHDGPACNPTGLINIPMVHHQFYAMEGYNHIHICRHHTDEHISRQMCMLYAIRGNRDQELVRTHPCYIGAMSSADGILLMVPRHPLARRLMRMAASFAVELSA